MSSFIGALIRNDIKLFRPPRRKREAVTMRTVGISGEITALVSELFQTAGSDVTGSERGDRPLHWLGDALSKGNTALPRPRLCLSPGSQQRHLPGSTAGTAGTAQHPFLPQLCGWEMLN